MFLREKEAGYEVTASLYREGLVPDAGPRFHFLEIRGLT